MLDKRVFSCQVHNQALLNPPDKLYSASGRASIAPEYVLRALRLQTFYSARSERQLVEQLGEICGAPPQDGVCSVVEIKGIVSAHPEANLLLEIGRKNEYQNCRKPDLAEKGNAHSRKYPFSAMRAPLRRKVSSETGATPLDEINRL